MRKQLPIWARIQAIQQIQTKAAKVQNDFDEFNQAPSGGKYQAAVTYSNDLASLTNAEDRNDPSLYTSQQDFTTALTGALQGEVA